MSDAERRADAITNYDKVLRAVRNRDVVSSTEKQRATSVCVSSMSRQELDAALDRLH